MICFHHAWSDSTCLLLLDQYRIPSTCKLSGALCRNFINAITPLSIMRLASCIIWTASCTFLDSRFIVPALSAAMLFMPWCIVVGRASERGEAGISGRRDCSGGRAWERNKGASVLEVVSGFVYAQCIFVVGSKCVMNVWSLNDCLCLVSAFEEF